LSLLYVYGVTAGVPARLGQGMKRERLWVVTRGRLAMVVGSVESAPLAVPLALKAHDAVVRRLAAQAPAILPARFGCLIGDEKEAREALRRQSRDLATALKLVRGCVQMTVRVFGTAASVPPSAVPAAPHRGLGAGLRYLLERQRAQQAAQALPEIEALRTQVASLLRAERVERLGRQGLLGTAYHLVEREHLPAYRAGLRRALPSVSPMRVHLSGPWAPYAFAPAGLS
jgi:hypothetical protein